MIFSCHCAITNCDHMVDVLKHNISNCKAIYYVKMHHTRSISIIIKNSYVLNFKELTDDIACSKNSLLLDESNDISFEKLLLSTS